MREIFNFLSLTALCLNILIERSLTSRVLKLIIEVLLFCSVNSWCHNQDPTAKKNEKNQKRLYIGYLRGS